MLAKIDPTRADYLKRDMDGIMRPRRWLMADEIAAFPADTVLWRNVVNGRSPSGLVFCTKTDAQVVIDANKRDAPGLGPWGKPVAITAGELQN